MGRRTGPHEPPDRDHRCGRATSRGQLVRSSAGLLLYRSGPTGWEVLLVHPGGPFWAGKDAGAWSIPKGEYGSDEDPHTAAVREFTEELGFPPPPAPGPDLDLGVARQSAAKTVVAFARPGDADADAVCSNRIEIDWPPRSGRRLSIPEVDRAAWCNPEAARQRLVRGQVVLLDRLLEILGAGPGQPA